MPTSDAQQVIQPLAQLAPASAATKASKRTPAPALPETGPNGEPLEHVGESLREMVIRSMHDEAQKRKTGDPTKHA